MSEAKSLNCEAIGFSVSKEDLNELAAEMVRAQRQAFRSGMTAMEKRIQRLEDRLDKRLKWMSVQGIFLVAVLAGDTELAAGLIRLLFP